MRNLAIVAQEAHYNLRLCTISKINFTFKIVTFKHLKKTKFLTCRKFLLFVLFIIAVFSTDRLAALSLYLFNKVTSSIS